MLTTSDKIVLRIFLGGGEIKCIPYIYCLPCIFLNMHKQADKEHGKKAGKPSSKQANMLASKIICLPSNIRLVVIKNAVCFVCLFVCFTACARLLPCSGRFLNSR